MRANDKQTRTRRALVVLGHWLRAGWPILLTVVGGYFFWHEVKQSIESTPHPALVYTIFFTFGAGVLLLGWAMRRFVAEESLLLRLQRAPREDRAGILEALRYKPDLLPVYQQLAEHSPLPEAMRQAAIENELAACEHKMMQRTALAGFIGGALVGIGLVGTFIGLLGTLQDLGALFAALTNTGDKNASAVDLFSDMVKKLQAPIRGMGTAFVASLYGLVGSLVLGLIAQAVRATAHEVVLETREFVGQDLHEGSGGEIVVEATQGVGNQTREWVALLHVLRQERHVLSEELGHLRGEMVVAMSKLAEAMPAPRDSEVSLLQAMERLAQSISAPREVDHQLLGAMDRLATAVGAPRDGELSLLKALEGVDQKLGVLPQLDLRLQEQTAGTLRANDRLVGNMQQMTGNMDKFMDRQRRLLSRIAARRVPRWQGVRPTGLLLLLLLAAGWSVWQTWQMRRIVEEMATVQRMGQNERADQPQDGTPPTVVGHGVAEPALPAQPAAAIPRSSGVQTARIGDERG